MTSREVEAALAHDLPRERDDWGWNWSLVKSALEHLFWAGELSSSGRTAQFERRYAVPARVLPPALRAEALAPEARPDEPEAFRGLVEISARAHGVGTEQCLRTTSGSPRSRHGRRSSPSSPTARSCRPRSRAGGAGLPPSRRPMPPPRAGPGLAVAVRLARVAARPHRALFGFDTGSRSTSREATRARLLRAALPARRRSRGAGRPQGRPRRRCAARAPVDVGAGQWGSRRPARAPRGARPARCPGWTWPTWSGPEPVALPNFRRRLSSGSALTPSGSLAQKLRVEGVDRAAVGQHVGRGLAPQIVSRAGRARRCSPRFVGGLRDEPPHGHPRCAVRRRARTSAAADAVATPRPRPLGTTW